MKHLFAALFLIFCISAFAQKPGTIWPKGEVYKDYNLKDAKGRREGLWAIQDKNKPTNMVAKGNYKADVKVGKWEVYAVDGSLAVLQDYKYKTADSTEATFYHADGKTIASKGLFVMKKADGKWKKEGKWKLYNEKSVLVEDVSFQDSLYHGTCKFFFQDGRLLKTESFKMGLKDGPFTEYYDNGKKRAEGTYLLDEKNGDYKAWFENGIMDCEGKFLKGLEDGLWIYYNEDGTPKVAIQYEKGKEIARKYQNGTFKEYYDSGIPKNEYTYEDAKLNGPFVEWYDKGEYALETPEDPQLQKDKYQKLVLKGTQEKCKGDYQEGKLQGEVIYYREDGRVEKIEIWNEGVLTSTKAP